MERKIYNVTLTRDVTESVVIRVEAEGLAQAEELAFAVVDKLTFELDDNYAKPYVSESFEEPLAPFRVMLREEKGDKFQIAFDCMAEDFDHAAEQAENAYPGGDVRSCTRISLADYMQSPS